MRPNNVTWRHITDWTKRSQWALRLADFLGRSRGRTHLLDRMHTPATPRHRPNLANWHRNDLSAAWIGHATVLLRIGQLNILTDPVLSNRIGVGLGLMTGGPRRLVAPAISLKQLPPIDLILVSHAHYDHLDRPTLCRLSKRIPIVTSEHTADLIRDLGFRRVTELRWGESMSLASVRITSHPVNHWGARTFYDSHRGVSAFVIESGRRRILYGGDTAYHEGFKDIGKVDLAVMGIGAYDPYIQAHATPEQALAMADHVRADYILPMHHSTFRLSLEPDFEPINRMLAAAGANPDRIIVREVGEQFGV